MIVVDASVVLKWFLREESSDAALELIKNPLHAPAIVREEVINGLVRAVRHKRITGDDAKSMVTKWQSDLDDEVPFLIDHDYYLDKAISYSIEMQHSYYDCLYLALAETEKGKLVTADQKFYQRAIQHFSNIELLVV